MSKWAALCSELTDLRDVLNQELPDGVRGDGSERFSASCVAKHRFNRHPDLVWRY